MERSDPGKAEVAIGERLEAAPRVERPGILLGYLGEVISEIVGRPTQTELRADQRIFELGIGSLIVVELKNRLESSFALELPVALFFKHSTLGEIAGHLLQQLEPAADADDLVETVAREAAADPDPGPQDPGQRIAELSEEQAEAEMLAKLTELESRFPS